MVSNAIFVVKFNTWSQKVWKFHLRAHNIWQGCQIVDIDALIDRSTQYICNNVLFYGSGRHFQSEMQHPAYKRIENFLLVLINSDKVARLSILMSHLKGLFNIFVTRWYLMVSGAIFTVKFNTRTQISMKISLKCS